MAFQRVPETAEISVIQSLQGVTIQNTFHARKTGGYSESDLANLANVIDINWATYVLPYQSTTLVYNKTEVRGLDDENDLIKEDADNTGFGGIASAPLPNNVAFTIKRLSGFTGRSARGRLYIGGIPQAANAADENFITSTYANNYAGGVDSCRSAIVGASWVPVIVSRYSNGVLRTTGVTFTWATTTYTDLRLDSRRDRLP